MILEENKYKTLVRAGEWKSPEDQKEILAMRVQVDEIKKKKESRSRRFEWKKKKKPSDLKEVKQVNDKKYHWCPRHALWTLHKPK